MASTFPNMANGGRMTMLEALSATSSSTPPNTSTFLTIPFDIMNDIYRMVAQESPSICQYSRGMDSLEYGSLHALSLHALSLVNKQVRSEFNDVLVKVNGSTPRYRQDINVWAQYQYIMQIRNIAAYDQISGFLHDGHIITNKPFVLQVRISMPADYNYVRHILLRLRNEWSHNPKLMGVSIRFVVDCIPRDSAGGMTPIPGLTKGHWTFWRTVSGVWEGKFWKTNRNSLGMREEESIEDIGGVCWPIDAHTLQLYEEF
ncbi:hypothetical protein E6O75_ATG09974 [Venturia nashicola]|uniref:F-box domain-containing protein n=1 Tax=Venturia nashicola TaxID=86259 RepID=A0A4Z1NYT3_9PEZI|nr:hypothetical protein E6O75_ATG09974 [Venturia nashicola]